MQRSADRWRRPDGQKGGKALIVALLASALLAITSYASRAEAHAIGLSSGEYTARGASVAVKLAFARAEVASLAPSIDTNHDGHLSALELDAARSTLRDKILGRINVTAAGAACAAAITDAGLTEQDGLLLSGRWDCPTSDKPFDVDLALLDDLSRGHRHVARSISGHVTHDDVLYGDHRKFAIAPDAGAAGDGGSTPAPVADRRFGALSFIKMGVEHILTGYDHLVFILGLVLVRARFRSILTTVTAFTIAHSITLALAVLDVWSPSPRIIEPAIALSIAYVGIENFFVKDGSKRWRITFPFGLVHGFGFAGALKEIALPRGAVPTALVSFNVGVETGQLAVLAVLLPLVLFLRKKSWFEPLGVRIVSGAVALAGGIWFVARIIE